MQDNGLVIDRSRITHGESKRVAVISMRLQQAQREMNADKVEQHLNEIDEVMGKIVVGVPDGWLPKGVSIGDKGWLDHLSQACYEEIMQAAQPATPGEKKA